MASTPDIQFICSDGNIVPAWKSLLSVSSEQFAQLLDDADTGDKIVSVNVPETIDTILSILDNLKGDQNVIDEKVAKAAYNIGIPFNKEKRKAYQDEDNIDKFVINDEEYKIQTDKIEIKTETENNSLIYEEDEGGGETLRKPKKKKLKKDQNLLHCDQCKYKKGFKTKTARERHSLKFHKSSILCEKCSNSFADYSSFQEHMKTHLIQCSRCNKKFNTRKKYQIHNYNVHEKTEKYPCPHCGIFVKNIQIHINYKHTETDVKTCPFCDYTHKSLKEIDRHYRKIHTEIDVTNCTHCGKVTKNLKRHLARNQCDKNIEERVIYQCDDCGKKFSLATSLSKHKKGIHENIKDKMCPHCSYCTYSGYNLKLHLNKMHLGKTKMKETCDFCGIESFSLQYHLKLYHAEKYIHG